MGLAFTRWLGGQGGRLRHPTHQYPHGEPPYNLVPTCLEAWQQKKRNLNDADDGGQGGQHHQHHWGSVSPFLASRAPR